MSDEGYVQNAKLALEIKAQLEIEDLKRYAIEEHIELDWVIRTYLEKFRYEVKKVTEEYE